MRLLLQILLFAGALTSGFAYANHHGDGPGKEGRSFEEVKEYRLKKIDEMRSCVARAKSFDEMKTCRPKRKPKPEGGKGY